jgi:hypothetical protein
VGEGEVANASRLPCREAAILLAGAGLLPEPEREEGPLAPALGQLSGELGGSGELAGGEDSAGAPGWRVWANIEAHAMRGRCVGT